MPLTRYVRSSVTRFNAETLTYQANILANSGTISGTSLVAVDNFVTACKAAGVWAKLLDAGVFAGNQLAAALTKLVYVPSGTPYLINHNFTSGDYAETGASGGLQGNASSKYLDTSLQTNVVSLIYGPVAALSFYSRGSAVSSGTHVLIGATDTNGPWAIAEALSGSNPAEEALWGSASAQIAWTGSRPTGLWTAVNTGPSLLELYLDGAAVAPGSGTANPNSAQTLTLFAQNSSGGPSEYSNALGTFYAISTVLQASDVAALYTAVLALQTALNRQ